MANPAPQENRPERVLLTTTAGVPYDISGLETLVQRAASTARLLSAANTTNATVVKASAGTLYRIEGWNAATVTYLKIYDKATTPSEADTPRHTFYLPASLKFQINMPNGEAFTAGISYRLTTAGADNDTGAVAAAAVLAMNVDYT